MASIKSKNTKPEVIVRKFLFAHGFRFRINVKKLPGTPDIVLKKYRTCIFVNGCFWHGHEGCKYFVPPKTNTEFWYAKFRYNQERDARNYQKIRDLGWRILIIWECEIRHGDPQIALEELIRNIRG